MRDGKRSSPFTLCKDVLQGVYKPGRDNARIDKYLRVPLWSRQRVQASVGDEVWGLNPEASIARRALKKSRFFLGLVERAGVADWDAFVNCSTEPMARAARGEAGDG